VAGRALVAAVVLVLGSLAGSALAQEGSLRAPAPMPWPTRPPRTISVSGEGKVAVAPDSASFTVGVESTAKTVGAATAAGATTIPVASATGISAGHTINIDSGANFETAVVVSIGRGPVGPGRGGPGGAPGRGAAGGGPGGGPGRGPTGSVITVAAPLRSAHAAGAQISGAGITLTTALTRAHASGAQVASDVPTPGAPNKYFSRRR